MECYGQLRIIKDLRRKIIKAEENKCAECEKTTEKVKATTATSAATTPKAEKIDVQKVIIKRAAIPSEWILISKKNKTINID